MVCVLDISTLSFLCQVHLKARCPEIGSMVFSVSKLGLVTNSSSGCFEKRNLASAGFTDMCKALTVFKCATDLGSLGFIVQ